MRMEKTKSIVKSKTDHMVQLIVDMQIGTTLSIDHLCKVHDCTPEDIGKWLRNAHRTLHKLGIEITTAGGVIRKLTDSEKGRKARTVSIQGEWKFRASNEIIEGIDRQNVTSEESMVLDNLYGKNEFIIAHIRDVRKLPSRFVDPMLRAQATNSTKV
jgi:hypothetical protein